MSAVLQDQRPPAPGLKARVLRAATWTLMGYAGAQVLRILSNLVMTRLLFPEAFGMMAIVTSVLVGVSMFSDLGVSESIVRNVRGEVPSFVNTAWTLQILRGALIGLILVVAALPISHTYHRPELAQYIMMSGLISLISGFNSTKQALADRKLMAGRITVIDLGCQVITIAVSIAYALYSPTPWALVWGNVASTLAKVIASHRLLHGPANKIHWERAEVRNILSFGLWITFSSSLTFFVGEGNKLVLAKVLSLQLVGLVGLSSALNMMCWSLVSRVASKVFYPAYAEVLRNHPERFSQTVERSRMAQIIPTWLVCLTFVCLGPYIIGFMYDKRYADAGFILQIQAMGMMVSILSGSYVSVLWSMGRIDVSVGLLIAQVCSQLGGMLIGSALGGHFGAIVGASAANFAIYLANALVFGRFGLWHPRVDIPALIASCAVMLVFVASGRWRFGLTL